MQLLCCVVYLIRIFMTTYIAIKCYCISLCTLFPIVVSTVAVPLLSFDCDSLCVWLVDCLHCQPSSYQGQERKDIHHHVSLDLHDP